MKRRPSLVRLFLPGAIAVVIAACIALPAPVRADPPPWAPAHGYRDKQDNDRDDDYRRGRKHRKKGKHERGRYRDYEAPVREEVYYAPDVGIPSGRCNRETLGAILGGAAGGYLGSNVGSGSGRLAATAAGTVIGLIIGGSLGRTMDRVDHACVGQVLEQAETGRSVEWVDPGTRSRYAVTPTRTYKTEGDRYCREYTSEAVIGGDVQRVFGTACRNTDGSWQLMSSRMTP